MATENGLAAKINELIKAAGDPSYETLAREIKAEGGPTVSAAYLWQLRTGARANPTFAHLQALCGYFSRKLGIPVTLQYFDPHTAVDQPWRQAAQAGRERVGNDEPVDERDFSYTLAERGIRRIFARYGEMGPNMLRDILSVMEEITAQGAAREGAHERRD